MKFENNWRFKTLENLEKEVWPEIDSGSHLIKRTRQLRKIPLNEFTVEDLRIMIGQDFGLDYLIPLAIEKLKEDILAEGDFYPGDLLKAVASSKPGFWKINPTYKEELQKLITGNLDLIIKEKVRIEREFCDAVSGFTYGGFEMREWDLLDKG